MSELVIGGAIGGALGLGAGYAMGTMLPKTLPQDVELQINRLSFLDTVSGLEMAVKTVFNHFQSGDWEEWVVGFGYSVSGEAQVIARIGKNVVTGEISAGIAKFGSSLVEVYLDGALFGTLEQYTGVGTPFAGWIGITLIEPIV